MTTSKKLLAIFLMAYVDKMGDTRDFYPSLMNEIPWLLLPNAFRAYLGKRQPSHSESNARLVYPDAETLRKTTKTNFDDMVKYYLPDDITQSIIGGKIDLGSFDQDNRNHEHFNTLRGHLLLDGLFRDLVCSEMYDVRNQFDDEFVPYCNRPMTGKEVLTEIGVFKMLEGLEMDDETRENLYNALNSTQKRFVHHGKRVLTGKQVKQEIGVFERLSFLAYAGKVYEATGILMNRMWFEFYVNTPLRMTYSEELAKLTYSYVTISPEVDDRINRHEFALTDEEIASLGSPDHLAIMDEFFLKGHELMRREIC